MTKYQTEVEMTEMAGNQVDLESLGLSEVAYLKAAVVDEMPGFAIYAANGVAIGFAPERDQAIGAIMSNEMALAAVH
jgi:hypothetical protein